MDLVLDACALIWYFNGSKQLSEVARSLIDAVEHTLYIPMIALLEVEHRHRRGKESFGWTQILEFARSRGGAHIVPMTLEIMQYYPDGLEIHDSAIVATALWLKHDLPSDKIRLLTNDLQITGQGLVQVLW